MDFIIFLKNNFLLLTHKADVDQTVLFGILRRFWSIIAGPVTLIFIAHKFSPQLQGYYYTFLSIITFQFLVELGLSNMIIQFASHEWARLSIDRSGKITGDRGSLLRLQSLAQMFFRWYCFASTILIIGLVVSGYWFFSRSQVASINWALPWFSLCFLNGIIFCLVPIWALLEGCNQVATLYTYKFAEGVFLSVSLWISMFLGAQLWAIVISNTVIVISAMVFLNQKYRVFLKTLLFSHQDGAGIKWQEEVFSLQWRVALTTLIGPFAYNLFVPVLFKYYGSVVAGQMGMTWVLATGVISIAYIWLSPKIPQFGMLIAKRRYSELDNLFWRTTKIAVTFAIVGAGLAWFTLCILNISGLSLATRFLPLLPTGIFLFSQCVLVIGVPFAVYLRIHKKEPLLFLSLISGFSVASLTLFLGKNYSALGMAIGYLLVNLISTPIVIIIWHNCRGKWHKKGYAVDMAINNSAVIDEVLS